MIDGVAYSIFAQGVGFLGTGADLYAANQKDDKRLIRLIVISSLIFAAHFSLLFAWTAVLSECITALRYYLADKYKKLWVALVFVGIYIAAALLTAQDFLGYLPFLASITGTLAIYLLKGVPLRLLFIFGQAVWLYYCTQVFSLGGIVLYVALIVMTGTTAYRIFKEKAADQAA